MEAVIGTQRGDSEKRAPARLAPAQRDSLRQRGKHNRMLKLDAQRRPPSDGFLVPAIRPPFPCCSKFFDRLIGIRSIHEFLEPGKVLRWRRSSCIHCEGAVEERDWNTSE